MTQEITMDVLHSQQAAGYTDISGKVNQQGHGWIAIVVAPDSTNTNITAIDVFRIVAGQPISQTADYRLLPNQGQADKFDVVEMLRSGDDLFVIGGTHTPGAGARTLRLEGKRIPGAFVGIPEAIDEDGAGLSLTPVSEGGTDVDYARVEAIVKFVVERVVGATESDSLVNKLTTGNVSVRTALRQISKQALVYLQDPANYNDPNDPEHLAQKYQDAVFSFNKNAAANPLANVLGGSDAWGMARRNELKAAVREVLHEAAPPKGGTK